MRGDRPSPTPPIRTPAGVKVAGGARPGAVDGQRTVLATGTGTAQAEVRVQAHRLPR